MKTIRGMIALWTAGCLLQFTLLADIGGPSFNTTSPAASQQLAQYGAGADLRVALADGSKLRGRLTAWDDRGFVLSAKQGDRRNIAYGTVAKLQLAQNAYRGGKPDATEVRRVAMALGVGQHVVAKIPGQKSLHGNIVAIAANYFTVRLDHDAGVVSAPYDQVVHLEKNLSRGAKIALIVVAGVVIAALAVGYSVSD